MSGGQDTSGRKQDARRQISAGQFEAAIETLREQLAHDPADAEAHAMLGAAISMNGDPAGSLRHLEEAAFLEPGRAAYQYNLGYAHEQEGNDGAARGAFERALRIDPRYERATDGLRRLASQAAPDIQIPPEPPAPIITTPFAPPSIPSPQSAAPIPSVQQSTPVEAPAPIPVQELPVAIPLSSVEPIPVVQGNTVPVFSAVTTPLNSELPGSAAPEDAPRPQPTGTTSEKVVPAEVMEWTRIPAPAEVTEPPALLVPADSLISEGSATNRLPSSTGMPSIVRALRAINILWVIVGLFIVAYGLSTMIHPATLSSGRVHEISLAAVAFGGAIIVLNSMSFVGASRRARRTWDLGLLVGLLGLIGGPFGLALWLYLLGKWFLPETKAWFRMRAPSAA